MEAIPREMAWQLCQEARQANHGKWYTLNWLRCWRCSSRSGGDPARMCFASSPDFRGCGQVNARYDVLPRPAPPPVEEMPPEPVSIIYLPPAGFSARQRRMVCVGCGRQFRLATGQTDAEYCPTCDYRRVRGQLIQQDSGGDLEDSPSVE